MKFEYHQIFLGKEILDTIENARIAALEGVEAKSIKDRMLFVKKYNNLTLSELVNISLLTTIYA